MEESIYANPEYFYLFALLPVLVIIYILKNKRYHPSIKVSSTEAFRASGTPVRQWLKHILLLLRLAILSLIIIAIARPQTISTTKEIYSEGIDIILAIDLSESMKARDFKPDRLGSAKKTAKEFVDKRKGDRIGAIVFGKESLSLCPLTIDHKKVKETLDGLKLDKIDGTATAIGDGLSTAVTRIMESKAKSKVIILLTDGSNNAGTVSPADAAEIAFVYGIKVYTIGVGSKGYASVPVKTPYGTRMVKMKVDLDEKTLKEIASTTKGKYFRATNNKSLENIYNEIDKMEKTETEPQIFKKTTEEHLPYALIAGLLFLAELLLRYFVFRSIP